MRDKAALSGTTSRAQVGFAARLVRVALAGLGLLLLAGCADTQYYWQSVNGHLRLMQAAQPVAQWLQDSQTPASLKERLRLSQRG